MNFNHVCFDNRMHPAILNWLLPLPITWPGVVRARLRQITFVCIVVGVALVGGWWHWMPSPVSAGTCTAGSAINQSFTSGARWELCWAERVAEGIVLSDIYYTPPAGERRKVLQEAGLSQIEVLYDDGLATDYYTSNPGLGGNQLLTLTAADCPSGTLLSNGARNLLCQRSGARGYLYKYYTTQR